MIVAADLDGTLLPHGGKISKTDLQTLHSLGDKGVTRVIATGRSFYAFKQDIPNDFPIDYLVFSTGSGIMNWKTGEILQKTSMQSHEVEFLVSHMHKFGIDFMLHMPVPDTHKFYYYATEKPNSDFYERMEYFKDFCSPLEEGHYPDSCQLLAFIEYDLERYEKVTKDLTSFNVLRETSPLNKKNMWIEVFKKGVSKGHALQRLAEELNVPSENVMAIGNDFNDIDMLEFAGNSYVVNNAPSDLKSKYQTVTNAANSGFTEAAKLFFNRTI